MRFGRARAECKATRLGGTRGDVAGHVACRQLASFSRRLQPFLFATSILVLAPPLGRVRTAPLRQHGSHLAGLSPQLRVLLESTSLAEQGAEATRLVSSSVRLRMLQDAFERRLARLLGCSPSGARFRHWNCGLEASARRGKVCRHLLQSNKMRVKPSAQAANARQLITSTLLDPYGAGGAASSTGKQATCVASVATEGCAWRCSSDTSHRHDDSAHALSGSVMSGM